MPSMSLFLLAAMLTAFSAQQPQNHGSLQTSPPSPSTGTPQAQPSPAPQTDSSANQRIQSSVDDLLSSDPVLSGSDVEVKVDDRNITLTGHVESYAQHQRALQLVAQYGRWRNIVDKIQMK